MSVSNLFESNNQTIYCKKLFADNLDINNIEVNNVIVDNATVLAQVTTPHITSGTSLFNTIDTITINAATTNTSQINAQNINGLTITADNVNAANSSIGTAVINDLTINNSINATLIEAPVIKTDQIQSFSSGNIFLGNYTLGSDINLSSSIQTPSTRTNTITTTTGTGNINVQRPIICNDDITCNNLFVLNNGSIPTLSSTNGYIDSLNGSNVQYSTGNIGTLNGTYVEYETGYIPTLSTKELTVFSSIAACPTASIDVINSTGTISSPNMNTDALNSYSGGNIAIGYPLSLPNIRPSSLLAYYQYTNGTLNVTGCITGTIGYYAVRIGNSVTLYLQTSQSFATATATYIISGFPTQFYSNVVPIRGACSVNSATGPVMGSYTFSITGVFIVYSGVGGGAFPAGPICGLNGLAGEYVPFHIISN